jgi:hypothetical protein
MSERTKKPVGDRLAVAHSRGTWHHVTDAEHDGGQTGIVESAVRPRETSPGITINPGPSALGVEPGASGSYHHDVLVKLEAHKQAALWGAEALLIDGAGI